MKKIFSICAVAAFLLCGCDDKLDIVPKGKTTLDNIADLETLLEGNWQLSNTLLFETLCGNTYPETWETPEKILADKTTEEYAMLAGDESVDRVELATSDYTYRTLYSNINAMNVIISKADGVKGDASQKRRVKAEAHILRAWFHFIAVNIYAAQYDEASASSLGGIAYVDNTNVQEQKTKRTIQQVYDAILDDCSDEIIADLRQEAVDNPFRFGAEFGNAVRASVLFQMKRYSEAIPYARKAISLNGTLEDRTKVLNDMAWSIPHDAPNNYLMIYHNNSNIGEWGGMIGTPEFIQDIDPNDVLMVLGKNTQDGWQDPMGYGPEGSMMCGSWDVHYNTYGIRTENMFYLLAEALIRGGQYNEGLRYVDQVRDKRMYENTEDYFSDTSINSEAKAMEILQKNKRIEMFTTVYNYLDRKRWNTESNYRKDMIHNCGNGLIFKVSPESDLWITPFPKTATNYNSSLTQNY